MKLNYNVTGQDRKALVAAVSEVLDIKSKYLGGITAIYEVGQYRLDKHGILAGPDNLDLEIALKDKGFNAEAKGREYDEPDTYESGLCGMGAVDYFPEIEGACDQHYRGAYAKTETTAEMLRQAEAFMEGQPEFEDLRLTEREELGLGRERRDHRGEDGMQASDVPDTYTYKVELSHPGCMGEQSGASRTTSPDYPDRFEVFTASDDEDALRQAHEFCVGDIILLELHELDDDYNVIRSVDLPPNPKRLTIEVPLGGFTPEKLDNLAKLVNAKAPLLKAALGTDDLPIQQTADTLRFPWFHGDLDADHVKAYAILIEKICAAAKEKQRVTAREKEVENPKYAMRCWLLALGFIGSEPEYKMARKIILSGLEGNGSWKNKQVYTAHCYTYPNGEEGEAMDCDSAEYTSIARAKAHADAFAADVESIKFAGAHVEDEKGVYVYELLCD